MSYYHFNSSRRSRSGVTLLFVVSMIVLFLLMGTAFVLVSNDFFRAAKQRSKKHVFANDQNSVVEQAFYDLFRGTELSDSSSPLRGHSLLADMYGYGFTATVESATTDSSDHFISLRLNSDTTRIIDRNSFALPPIDGLLSGRVISIVNGSARGLSARIVDHQIDRQAGGTHRLILLPTKMDSGFELTDVAAIAGDQVIINGRPFAGSGAGHYDPFTARSIAALSDAALEPNQAGRSLDQLIGNNGIDGSYFSISTSGVEWEPNSAGPNESYDTFDYQNMFLAGIKPDGSVVAPSFHRDGLLGNPRGDFRAFPGGGPNGDGISVDNNNDGRPEGIWIDGGHPIQTRSDGICVKPLVSYTVIDMGGKLNVNAHGSPLRSLNEQFIPIDLLGNGKGSRGQGLGPPEINLAALVSTTNSLINGTAALPGRYGFDGKPGQPDVRDAWSGYKLFGYPNAPFDQVVPGTVTGLFGSVMDIHGRFSFGYPQIFDISGVNPEASRDFTGPAKNLFPIGMPVANVGFSTLTNEIADSPYEMNFTSPVLGGPGDGGSDEPFAPAELEAVLRRRDPDSNMLPRRLLELGSFQSGPEANSITTDSFEVPTTFDSLPEMLYEILDSGTEGIPSDAPDRENKIAQELNKLLPPEIFRGLPLNVNRQFGDGVDNNGNGLTDELGEVDQIDHPAGGEVRFDYDNDGIVQGDFDSRFARANFARHLFVVTLLVTERIDRDGDGLVTEADWFDFNDDGSVDEADFIDYRRVIAQWAINVVDFRDPDSIMTGFEVDLNPFNGWDVDGDINTIETVEEGTPLREMREVFWGAERPELLITETLATHDRRTQDLRNETVADGGQAGQTVDGIDQDFDSFLVPKVSAFFELYNPWVMNDANQIRPAELYESSLNGVDLQKTSRDGSSPVWRLVVTDNGQAELDPDTSANNADGESVKIVRRIYFVRPVLDSGPEVYFPEPDVEAGFVGPGRYAVVGTQGRQVGDRYDTYFGRRLTPDALDKKELEEKTRRISLDWKNGEIQLLRWSGTELEVVTRPTPPEVEQPITDAELQITKMAVIPIGLNDGGWARELGVSDPLEGYVKLPGDVTTAEIEDGMKFVDKGLADFTYDQPIDQQLDEDHYNQFLRHDGLRPGYRTVHLQRLANPLEAFHQRTNPYRTIDSSSLDLFVFNGADPSDDPNNVPQVMRFGTYERRGDFDSDRGQKTGRHRLLFKNDTLGRIEARVEDDEDGNGTADSKELDLAGIDNHIFSWNLTESFSNLNSAYLNSDSGEPEMPVPFCWLSWNNRPYASHLELVNVPHTSSYQMTRLFDIASGPDRDVYRPPLETQEITGARNYSAHFPHLLNFYADQTDAGGNSASLHRLLDYLEVPSRFVGTESYVNPETFADSSHGVSYGLTAPFDTISSYRYPGKINLNTVLEPAVWNGLMDFYALNSTEPVSFPDWERSRNGNGALDFANPLRPAKANNLVPPATGAVVDPVDCGLFRRGAGSDPLLDYDPEERVVYGDTDRAAYFRYDMRQRLGNLVTTRSSVFAIWITVGYFEVQADGSLRLDSSGRGVEWGRSSGESVRNRGFFLVDRSIPVAFEPGKNHNVDRAVLVKSLID